MVLLLIYSLTFREVLRVVAKWLVVVKFRESRLKPAFGQDRQFCETLLNGYSVEILLYKSCPPYFIILGSSVIGGQGYCSPYFIVLASSVIGGQGYCSPYFIILASSVIGGQGYCSPYFIILASSVIGSQGYCSPYFIILASSVIGGQGYCSPYFIILAISVIGGQGYWVSQNSCVLYYIVFRSCLPSSSSSSSSSSSAGGGGLTWDSVNTQIIWH